MCLHKRARGHRYIIDSISAGGSSDRTSELSVGSPPQSLSGDGRASSEGDVLARSNPSGGARRTRSLGSLSMKRCLLRRRCLPICSKRQRRNDSGTSGASKRMMRLHCPSDQRLRSGHEYRRCWCVATTESCSRSMNESFARPVQRDRRSCSARSSGRSQSMAPTMRRELRSSLRRGPSCARQCERGERTSRPTLFSCAA